MLVILHRNVLSVLSCQWFQRDATFMIIVMLYVWEIQGKRDKQGLLSTECCRAGAELQSLYSVQKAFKYKTDDTHVFLQFVLSVKVLESRCIDFIRSQSSSLDCCTNPCYVTGVCTESVLPVNCFLLSSTMQKCELLSGFRELYFQV